MESSQINTKTPKLKLDFKDSKSAEGLFEAVEE